MFRMLTKSDTAKTKANICEMYLRYNRNSRLTYTSRFLAAIKVTTCNFTIAYIPLTVWVRPDLFVIWNKSTNS